MDNTKQIEWDGDYESVCELYLNNQYNAGLAKVIGTEIYNKFELHTRSDTHFKLGWSVFATGLFCYYWTKDERVKDMDDTDAKVLYLAVTEEFKLLLFPEKNPTDLGDRVSKLADLSAKMHVELTYDNKDEQLIDKLETDFQLLFAETMLIYGK